MNAIGEVIRRLRQQKHWTMTTLSRLSGVSRGALYKIEAGKVVPELLTLQKLANAFSTPIEIILLGTGGGDHNE